MSDFQFRETKPHEQGFGEVFHREIVPILQRHEEERQAAAGNAKKWMLVAAAIGAAVTALLFAVGVWNFGIMAGFVAVFVPFGIKGSIQSKWRRGLSHEVLPIACDFLGELKYGSQKISPSAFTELGVTPRFSKVELDDAMTGSHGGLDYAITEARLIQRRSSGKSGSKNVTVFRGLLMKIELAEPAPSIFFARDHGGVGNWFADVFSSHRRGREKIEIADPEFENTYETYADDPEAARAYITTRLTEGLMLVARAETGTDYVSAALSGKGLYIAIPRKEEFLQLGSLFRPLHFAERDFHELLDELTLPRRVIDAFRGVQS